MATKHAWAASAYLDNLTFHCREVFYISKRRPLEGHFSNENNFKIKIIYFDIKLKNNMIMYGGSEKDHHRPGNVAFSNSNI